MIIHPHIPKRKKRKPTAAQRQLAADWEALLNRHTPKKAVSKNVQLEKAYTPVVSKVYVRPTEKIKSLQTFGGTATKPIEGKKYTGTKMIGIGTLHKSNAVPIFSEDDAKEQARMRRG